MLKNHSYLTAVSLALLLFGNFSSPSFAAQQVGPSEDAIISAQNTAILPTASPDEVTTSSVDRVSLEYLKGYFTDTGKIIASPLHWEKNDWLKVGLVAGITGGLFFADSSIRDFAQSNQSSVANKFATVGNALGNPFYTLPPLGAFYLYGSLTDDKKARTTALLAVESIAISQLFTGALKVIAQRDRPNTGASPDKWEGPHLSLKNLSFSSAHTSSAFSLAAVFAEEYEDSPYIPAIAYGLATLTGLSRIYDNEHWASDAFFGAAVGYFIGKAVVKFHTDDTAKKISIVPMVSSDYKGLTVSYPF